MDPIAEFRALFAAAEALDRAQLPEPTAMTLATVDADGAPSARVVLLKALDDRGFVFYTNFGSRKGRELAANPRAALRLPLAAARVAGAGGGRRWSAWMTRPPTRTSRVGRARASSAPGRRSRARRSSATTLLDARVREAEARFAGREVPRPPYWGGFRLVPSRIEFWHGRAHRLHERRVFERDGATRGGCTGSSRSGRPRALRGGRRPLTSRP